MDTKYELWEGQIDRIQSSEMWVWGRMENIKQMARVGNEEILIRIIENRTVLNTIRKRKGNCIGRSRGKGILTTVPWGNGEGGNEKRKEEIENGDDYRRRGY